MPARRTGSRCHRSTTRRCRAFRQCCPTSPSMRFPIRREGAEDIPEGWGTHTMLTSSLVVEQARQLAAAGNHAEVIEYLGTRAGRELELSPSLALLYGTAQGVAECRHNLAITYREQGALDRALAEADRAVAQAEAAGDRTLWAMALRGRAEIRVVRGEVGLARRELDLVREIRTRLPNPVAEAEDLRIAAMMLAAEDQLVAAERALREAIGRAEAHHRPLLQAEATRDLCLVLRRSGRKADAQAAARAAKGIFVQLGAEQEIRKLAGQEWGDDFAAEMRGSLAPLQVAL